MPTLVAFQSISSYSHSKIDSLELGQTFYRGPYTIVVTYTPEARQSRFVVVA